jgi:multidrug efflux pump subunit AcrB
MAAQGCLLEKGADRITTALKKSGKAVDVDTTNIPGRPEVRVSIDRDRAADLGVSVANVASTLQMLVAGIKASTFPEHGESTKSAFAPPRNTAPTRARSR